MSETFSKPSDHTTGTQEAELVHVGQECTVDTAEANCTILMSKTEQTEQTYWTFQRRGARRDRTHFFIV